MSDAFDDIFPGTSTMAKLMRAHDWERTPLGAPGSWPEALRMPLRMMLSSRFEMWLGWGPELLFFYNDAYIPTLGTKHPAALARPVAEVWSEIYADVRGRFDAVMNEGQSTWDEALLLLVERSGVREESYHTFAYSPLTGDDGATAGLFCVVSEETERVISERRLKLMNDLATDLLRARSRAEIVSGVAHSFARNTHDFPFHELRLIDAGPGEIDWPFGSVRDGSLSRVSLEGLIAEPPKGSWDVAPREAMIVPVVKAGEIEPSAHLVLGLNPYQTAGDDIAEFARLIASQIAGSLATIDAAIARESEADRLRDIYERSPSFIATLSGPDHRFEFVNPGYLQLVGHREVIDRTVREALPDLAGQGFFELLDEVYASGEAFVGQSMPVMIQRTPDAAPEERFVDLVYQPIRNESGAVTGIFAEGIDVTSAHDAIAALRDSERQFRTLAEAIPNHVWTARPDGTLDWFNDRVLEYAGIDPAMLDGASWASMVHRDDAAETEARWAQSVASGETYETEFRLRRGDGAYRWHLGRALAIRGETGEIERWIGTNTDIDDQKTAAQSLKDLNETLETQVRDRTGELLAAEEALRQSQKMEAVGQLTGGIAHDFNNLLAGIMGNLELLELRIAQGRLEAIPRHVEAAQSAAKRAAALTQRLLAFSRRQTLDPKPVNANRLIGGMEDLIRRTVGPAIELEVVGAGGVWPTLVDPYQLENALLNLCINARDAMPDGGRLTIETANKWLDDRASKERDLPPGQYLSLCVTDTGTGMAPEVIERAFDPFFTTKPLGEGTGLGLSMIYGFVRQSGGQVRIYSEIGQGTTMCLYLPRYVGELDDAAAAEEFPDAASADGHGETVLIVDDEPTVRAMVVDVLAESGYRILEAADGPAGVKIMQSDTRIDLLVTDVGLPGGMNGRQVADAGRALRPGLKILFITGYAENAVIGNGHLDRSVQVITKPFGIDAIAAKVRDVLDS